MDSFGAYLKRERELRGISIREVAQTTKISSSAIDALEQERFEQLGGEIFVRGFLRNYAKYLGLDPEDAILRYEEYRQVAAPATDAPSRAELPSLTSNPKNVFLAGGAFAAVVFVAIIVFSLSPGDPPVKVPEKVNLASLPVAVPEPAPAPLTAVTAEPVTKLVEKKVVALRIEAEQASYLKVWVDDAEPVEREMVAGSEMRFEAQRQIELRVGNAGGIHLYLNGKRLPQLGPEGKVRQRVVTVEGVMPP